MLSQIYTSLLSYLVSALQISLGIVFLLSALPKLRLPLVFAQSVVEYRVLPTKLAYVFAFIVIPLEALSAVAFLTGWLRNVAFLLATVMLLAFLVAVGINLRRGRKIPCGCFGETSEPISYRTLARLCMILAILLILIAFGDPESALFHDRGTLSIVTLFLTVFLAVFFLLLGSWVLNIPELYSLFRHLRQRELEIDA